MDDIAASRSSRWFRVVIALVGLVVLAASAIGVYVTAGKRTTPPGAAPQADVGWASTPQPLPDIRFQDSDGKPHALSEFRGGVVLLNVWATWCVPCRKEMPALDRLQQMLGGSDFQVVALSIDIGGVDAVRRFYSEIGIHALGIYLDPTIEATGKLRVPGIPTTLLLDREGRERWRKIGPAEWDAPEIVESLRAKLRGGAS